MEDLLEDADKKPAQKTLSMGDTPKPKPDTIVTSNQYLRQAEFDKVVSWFMTKTNIDAQCMADLMFTWILANGRWSGKASSIVACVENVKKA